MDAYEARVQRYIEQLRREPKSRFDQILIRALKESETVDLALLDALQSDKLAETSRAALDFLYQQQYRRVMQMRKQLAKREEAARQGREVPGPDREAVAKAERYRYALLRDLRSFQALVATLREETGQAPNTPNPRRRAMERLWGENLRGPVKRGRIVEIFKEEKENMARLTREARERREAARRAAKRQTESS